jgi:hypothetical protein
MAKPVVFVIGMAAVLAAGCSSGAAKPKTSVTAARLHHVVYQVDGTATTADLTLSTSNGGSTQQQNVSLPIKNKSGGDGLVFDAPTGTFLYLSAQNQSDGTITCHISVDGVEVVTNTSTGQYSIVTCDGRL